MEWNHKKYLINLKECREQPHKNRPHTHTQQDGLKFKHISNHTESVNSYKGQRLDFFLKGKTILYVACKKITLNVKIS